MEGGHERNALVFGPAGNLYVSSSATDEVLPYDFTIAEDHAAEILSSDELLQVSITSNTWTPSDALGGEDTRELGVMVHRLRVD